MDTHESECFINVFAGNIVELCCREVIVDVVHLVFAATVFTLYLLYLREFWRLCCVLRWHSET